MYQSQIIISQTGLWTDLMSHFIKAFRRIGCESPKRTIILSAALDLFLRQWKFTLAPLPKPHSIPKKTYLIMPLFCQIWWLYYPLHVKDFTSNMQQKCHSLYQSNWTTNSNLYIFLVKFLVSLWTLISKRFGNNTCAEWPTDAPALSFPVADFWDLTVHPY